jgi:SAM-dependent methyltransferase
VSGEYYTKSFYEGHRNGVTRSAEVIVPLVLKLLPVRTVVDVGCGDGSWLSVFRKLGVDDVLGIDGDYVTPDLLQIPQDRFRAVDLTKPFSLGRVFDLAISLEVAEHLPAESASAFVESLTRQAPLVLFSAAIPKQGGNHHLNEQWPDYWAKLFQRHGYLPIDFLRRRIWQNDAVDWWYTQNALLFAQAKLVENNALLKAEFERTNPTQLSLVHPKQYLAVELVVRAQMPPPPSGVKSASRLLLSCLRNAVMDRLASVTGKKARSKEESQSARAATKT